MVKICPNDLLSLLSLQICGTKGTWTPSTALIMGSHDEADKIGKSLNSLNQEKPQQKPGTTVETEKAK